VGLRSRDPRPNFAQAARQVDAAAALRATLREFYFFWQAIGAGVGTALLDGRVAGDGANRSSADTDDLSNPSLGKHSLVE
jgi:hypothetical protein